MLESPELRYHKSGTRRTSSDHGPLRSMARSIHCESRSFRRKLERGWQQEGDASVVNAPSIHTIIITDSKVVARKSSAVGLQKRISWKQKCFKPDDALELDATAQRVRAGSSPKFNRKSSADPTSSNRLHDMLEVMVNQSWKHLESKPADDTDSVTLFDYDDPIMDDYDDMTAITDPIYHLNNFKEIRLSGVNRPNVKIYRYPQQHIPAHLRHTTDRPRIRQSRSAPAAGYDSIRETTTSCTKNISSSSTKPAESSPAQRVGKVACEAKKSSSIQVDSSTGKQRSMEESKFRHQDRQDAIRLSTIPELVVIPFLEEKPIQFERAFTSPSVIFRKSTGLMPTSSGSQGARETNFRRMKPPLNRASTTASF